MPWEIQDSIAAYAAGQPDSDIKLTDKRVSLILTGFHVSFSDLQILFLGDLYEPSDAGCLGNKRVLGS
jgi:hypothetical protein